MFTKISALVAMLVVTTVPAPPFAIDAKTADECTSKYLDLM
jgi:hypothetical protein